MAFVYKGYGRSLQMRKTKIGIPSMYIHQTSKPEFMLIMYPGTAEVINMFKIYHSISMIFILTSDQ